MMALSSWKYWRLTRVTDGELEWLALSRPDSRATIDRQKLWTLLPNRSVFIANWYVTEDHWREDDLNLWTHEHIDAEEAREVALAVPELSAVDLTRLTRPESWLTLQQIDRFPVDKILGKRVERALKSRR
jgi:hypothetical protein